ncbi:PREDICTED: aspartyl protease family protein At5g10770-like [Nelumbo nucifera]|uniref:Aspartyl protease family protein At5g10770-like n=1 Tax=Nelumbo nucifera TaxID=4432 RepID=A0A1U8AKT4_NELNU|nr:PREDICTED: aspartyl protease family protein At5g10770-like [Nelumbo nucifera]
MVSSGSDHYRKLQLVDITGPCSPLGKASLSLHEILLQEELRVRSIQSTINKQSPLGLGDSKTKVPIKSGHLLGTSNYIVKIGMGTPKQDFWVNIDTGSSLSWVRCQPCTNCSSIPTFAPSRSSSYSPFACRTPQCSPVYTATGHSPSCNSSCLYEVHYNDGGFSKGVFGKETLRITPSDVFPNFQFGCGNQNSFPDSTSGVLAFGRNQVSLVSQTTRKFGKVFSYCFPRTDTSYGYLALGKQPSTTSAVKYTKLVTDSHSPNYYFIPLIGISVGGKRLSLSPSVFTKPGTVIDSGTVVSRLPPLAYTILRSEFRRAMSNYPSAPPQAILDTCYNLSRNATVNVPPVMLHFGGGTDVQLDPFSGVLVKLDASIYCLGFAPNQNQTDVGILGNLQQRTYEVVYDLPQARIGFRAVGINC